MLIAVFEVSVPVDDMMGLGKLTARVRRERRGLCRRQSCSQGNGEENICGLGLAVRLRSTINGTLLKVIIIQPNIRESMSSAGHVDNPCTFSGSKDLPNE